MRRLPLTIFSSRGGSGAVALGLGTMWLGACATGVDWMPEGAGDGDQDAAITLHDGGSGDAGDPAVATADAASQDAGAADASEPDMDATPSVPDAERTDTDAPAEPDAEADTGTPAPDAGGGPIEGDATTMQPDASDASVHVDTGQPDAALPPVNCDALIRSGVQLCDTAADSCGVVFTNRGGCTAACAAGGLVCGTAYENVESQCARDESRPTLPCDSGHESDYCLCRRP